MPDPSIQTLRNVLAVVEQSLAELLDEQNRRHRRITELHRTLTAFLRTVRDKSTRPLLEEPNHEPELVQHSSP